MPVTIQKGYQARITSRLFGSATTLFAPTREELTIKIEEHFKWLRSTLAEAARKKSAAILARQAGKDLKEYYRALGTLGEDDDNGTMDTG